MALTITYSEASSNLPAYLDNWIDNFEYRGTGNFNAVKNTTDQWYAGTRIVGGVDNDKSSIIVSGDDFSYTPGIVDGTVTNLTLGSNLAYVIIDRPVGPGSRSVDRIQRRNADAGLRRRDHRSVAELAA